MVSVVASMVGKRRKFFHWLFITGAALTFTGAALDYVSDQNNASQKLQSEACRSADLILTSDSINPELTADERRKLVLDSRSTHYRCHGQIL